MKHIRVVDDEPIERIYYGITEVAALFGISKSCLRYWESEFKQLQPVRKEQGKRKYTERDIETVAQIHKLLKVEGYKIEGARRKLG